MVTLAIDAKAGSPRRISDDTNDVEEGVKPNTPPPSPGDVDPHTVFDIPGKKIKKHHIPPQKISGEFAPPSTDDCLIMTQCLPQTLDQRAYAQNAIVAKKHTEAAAANTGAEPHKENAQRQSPG